MLRAVGWPDAHIASRIFGGGASLAVGAPLDGLYAATLVNEWACEAAAASSPAARFRHSNPLRSPSGARSPRTASPPWWRSPPRPPAAAWRASRATSGSRSASARARSSGTTTSCPTPDQVDWAAVHDVPLILVTGTNGKSTTVRLLAAMARAAGKVAGLSSSDWVRVGDEILDRGDYSGPGGARLVLRDPRVEIAVLELARGGILRRGLPVDPRRRRHCHQHRSRPSGRVRHPGRRRHRRRQARGRQGAPAARLILNADDPRLVERSAAAAAPLCLVHHGPRPRHPGWGRARGRHARPARGGRRTPSSPRPRSASAWAVRRATTSPTPWPPSPVRPPWACPWPPWPRPCAVRRRRGRQSRPRRLARDRRRQGPRRLRPQPARRRGHREPGRRHPGQAPPGAAGPSRRPHRRRDPGARRRRLGDAARPHRHQGDGELPARPRARRDPGPAARRARPSGAPADAITVEDSETAGRAQRFRLGQEKATCWSC